MIERNDAVAKFVVDRALGCDLAPPFAGYVESEDGLPVAAAILNGFTGHDVHLTVAGRRVSLALARTVARICFRDWNVARVTAITRESNRPAIRCLARFGFAFEGRLEAYYGTEAAHLFGLQANRQILTGDDHGHRQHDQPL